MGVNIRRLAPTAVVSQQTGNGIATPQDLPAAVLLEDLPMATEITPAPTSKPTSTHAVPRLCGTCHKQPLSYNNVSNMCTGCQRQHGRPRPNGNGHNGGVRPHREPQAQPHKAAKNGADRDRDPVNGKAKGNGNGAQPAEDRLLGMPRVESSRLDILLAAIPREDKARMLTAWLAGSL